VPKKKANSTPKKKEKEKQEHPASVVVDPKTSVGRCSWSNVEDPMYKNYHDAEWGTPLYDDKKLFEFLILETFQAGLSWAIILKKRENFRKSFAGFDAKKVSQFGSKQVEQLMEDAGIVRNRSKIQAAITNAKITLEIQQEFGSLSNYFWKFVPNGKPILRISHEWKATSPESDKLSADLKKRGMKFVGSTVMYSHLQACGMINDHHPGCFKHPHSSIDNGSSSTNKKVSKKKK